MDQLNWQALGSLIYISRKHGRLYRVIQRIDTVLLSEIDELVRPYNKILRQIEVGTVQTGKDVAEIWCMQVDVVAAFKENALKKLSQEEREVLGLEEP